MSQPPITIGIADDHNGIRECIICTLSQDNIFRFVCEASDGEDLLSKLKVSQPDVILLDLHMPKMSGIEVLKLLKKEYPTIRVLIFTAYTDSIYVKQCLDYGINGYLSKETHISEIRAAINQAYQNKVYVNTIISKAFLESYSLRHGRKIKHLPEFSDIEIEILNLLKHERTTEEISDILSLSKRTIEIKRDKMREKSSSKTVAGLLLYALKRGFLKNDL